VIGPLLPLPQALPGRVLPLVVFLAAVIILVAFVMFQFQALLYP
jgi:hypothetical protein